MKRFCLLLPALGILLTLGSGRAEIVYEDTFDGNYGGIAGREPAIMSSTGAKWSAPGWMVRNREGEMMTTGILRSGMATLPMPNLKGTETIRASIEVIARGPSPDQAKSFIGIGFLPSASGALDTMGGPWARLQALPTSGASVTATGEIQIFLGPGSVGQLAKKSGLETGYQPPPDTNTIVLSFHLPTSQLTASMNGTTVYEGEAKVAASQIKFFGIQMSFVQGDRNTNGVVKWVQLEVTQE